MQNSDNNFSTLLASSVHDMKNSLGAIREMIQQLSKRDEGLNQDVIQLEFESNRMNNSLMQLLVLYKIESAHFKPAIDEYPVIDIFNEIVAQHTPLLSFNKMQLDVQCDDELYCYCDYELVCNTIGTILNNAIRYSRNKILLSATQQEKFIRFNIEDDGDGFPPSFIMDGSKSQPNVNFAKGSTGLGLYFASTIAGMHVNGEQQGHIEIENDSCLGGARFSLLLP